MLFINIYNYGKSINTLKGYNHLQDGVCLLRVKKGSRIIREISRASTIYNVHLF